MKRNSVLLALLATWSFGINAASLENTCMIKDCAAGTTAITYAKKNDVYFACPTKELAEYTNFIISLVALQASMGLTPNISPVTGEPEYTGQTKEAVDAFRIRAGVDTFGQAAGACSLVKKGGLKVHVANDPVNSNVIWVAENKRMFWMPKGHLSRVH